MYAALEKNDTDTESIAFASAMEDEVTEDPFIQQHVGNDSDFEPLHAIDAARRLLDTNDNGDGLVGGDAPPPPSDPAPFAMMGGVSRPESLTPMMGGAGIATNTNTTGNSTNTDAATVHDNSGQMRNSSLLERIQQQKRHQPSLTPIQSTAPTIPNAPPNVNVPPSSNNMEGLSITEGNYSYASGSSGPSGTTTTSSTNSTSGHLNIPQYSSTPRPNPYDNSSDYKDKMMTVLSAAGSVANTAAKGAVSGTKYIYNNLMSKTAASGGRNGLSSMNSGGGRMGEMDYQRESLLMDPHDLENSAAAFSSSAASSNQQEQQQRPPGMRSVSGFGDGSLSFEQQSQQLETSSSNPILVSLKQFIVDMKDLFLAAPRSAQIAVISIFALIVWLLFSEV